MVKDLQTRYVLMEIGLSQGQPGVNGKLLSRKPVNFLTKTIITIIIIIISVLYISLSSWHRHK
jgi:hypothetical protein